MKHRTSQALFGYWNDVRGDRMAPRRFDIEPSRISEILAETFILERDDSRTFPFRLAGTRICDQLGQELRGRNFLDLVEEEDHARLEQALACVTEQGAVGVFEIEACDKEGRAVRFETVVLPLTHLRQTVTRYLGCLSAIDPPIWLGYEPLSTARIVGEHLIWPDGRPHAVLQRNRRQAPFLPELANARVVRLNRRQFRVLDGGRKTFGDIQK